MNAAWHLVRCPSRGDVPHFDADFAFGMMDLTQDDVEHLPSTLLGLSQMVNSRPDPSATTGLGRWESEMYPNVWSATTSPTRSSRSAWSLCSAGASTPPPWRASRATSSKVKVMRLMLVAGTGMMLTAMRTLLSELPGEPPLRGVLFWKVADVLLAGPSCPFRHLLISGANSAMAGMTCIVTTASSTGTLDATACTTAAGWYCCGDQVTEPSASVLALSSPPRDLGSFSSLTAATFFVEWPRILPCAHMNEVGPQGVFVIALAVHCMDFASMVVDELWRTEYVIEEIWIVRAFIPIKMVGSFLSLSPRCVAAA